MEKRNTANIWAIDPVHSQVRFEVRYLLGNVSGWFRSFEGTVSSPDETFTNAELRVAIYANSVDTFNEERDRHLKSVDFFNAAEYPVIGYHSGKVRRDKESVTIDGIISIRDKQVAQRLDVSYLGMMQDPMGNTKAAFSFIAKLNRQQLGITWNQVLDRGGLLLSDDITLHADIQLLRLTANPEYIQRNQ